MTKRTKEKYKKKKEIGMFYNIRIPPKCRSRHLTDSALEKLPRDLTV